MAACQPAPTPSAVPEAETPQPPPEPRADLPTEQRSPDLFGAWLIEVAAAPGARQPEGWTEMILLVGNRQLQVQSQCVTVGPFDYGRTEGGGIVVSVPAPPRRSPESDMLQPPAQCARALSPAEAALAPILLAARTVKPDAAGSVTLAGQAGSLVLRRPTGALANPYGQAPPPALPPLLGSWRVLSLNGDALRPDERVELLLRPNHIEWRSGCVNESRLLRRDGDRLIPGEVDPFPVCERGRSDAEDAMERLLSAAVAARIAADGRLSLQGSGVVAELAPLTF